jgi:hypothetical protein
MPSLNDLNEEAKALIAVRAALAYCARELVDITIAPASASDGVDTARRAIDQTLGDLVAVVKAAEAPQH